MDLKRDLIPLLLRLALAVFFLWSGIEKLLRLDQFTEDIFNYQILFPPLDTYLAYLLPWIEIIAALALILPKKIAARGGLITIAALMIIFIIALGHAWARGLNINCGCFSSSEEPTNFPFAIARNLGLLLLTLALYPFSQPRRPHQTFDKASLILPD
ncbi:MAG: MauE/DoxX family redox-associated membrane protein [Verrucomicrobiota bacterium]